MPWMQIRGGILEAIGEFALDLIFGLISLLIKIAVDVLFALIWSGIAHGDPLGLGVVFVMLVGVAGVAALVWQRRAQAQPVTTASAEEPDEPTAAPQSAGQRGHGALRSYKKPG